MKNLFREIAYDAKFLKGHKLQPAWWKVTKVFVLLGVIVGFVVLFGWQRAVVFTVILFSLMLVVHMVYRVKTCKFTRNWMDFIVVEDKERNIKPSIGLLYYTCVLLNAVVAFFLSGFIV